MRGSRGVIAALVLVGSGCKSGEPFGACCTEDSVCGSGICDERHGHCSMSCSAASQCPNADEPLGAAGPGKCDDGLCESDYYERACTSGAGGGGGAGGSSGGAGGGSGGARDCTFPNDVTVCGCGNACGQSSGLCRTCGSAGSGCLRTEIFCCADTQCPSGSRCSTIGGATTSGNHLCVTDLVACTTPNDCLPGEPCVQGYCRD